MFIVDLKLKDKDRANFGPSTSRTPLISGPMTKLADDMASVAVQRDQSDLHMPANDIFDVGSGGYAPIPPETMDSMNDMTHDRLDAPVDILKNYKE